MTSSPVAVRRRAGERAPSQRQAMALRFEAAQAALARARAESRSASGAEVVTADPAAGRRTRPSPPTECFADLTPHRLRAHLAADGCVKVPNLVPAAVADELVAGIDRVLDGYDAWVADFERGVDLADCRTSEWFDPFHVDRGGSIHLARPWVRGGGAVFTGDSPRVADRWFRLIREIGLFDLITRSFGEEPITTLDKCALRRIGGGDAAGIEWHQDGSFLGEARAIDVWLCLSDTTRSPGLDIVSRRFDSLVETGTGSAGYEWTVAPEVVADLAETAPIVQPTFKPGDALIFDELLLHRTSQPEAPLPDLRYGIETWFFRPGAFPEQQQVPLAI